MRTLSRPAWNAFCASMSAWPAIQYSRYMPTLVHSEWRNSPAPKLREPVMVIRRRQQCNGATYYILRMSPWPAIPYSCYIPTRVGSPVPKMQELVMVIWIGQHCCGTIILYIFCVSTSSGLLQIRYNRYIPTWIRSERRSSPAPSCLNRSWWSDVVNNGPVL